MAIVRNNQNQSSARTRMFAGGDQPQVESKVWCNVGVFDAEGVFRKLPVGLPLDTMRRHEGRSLSPDYQCQNEVLDMFQEIGNRLAPDEAEFLSVNGGEVGVPGTVAIQVRRKREPAPQQESKRPGLGVKLSSVRLSAPQEVEAKSTESTREVADSDVPF